MLLLLLLCWCFYLPIIVVIFEIVLINNLSLTVSPVVGVRWCSCVLFFALLVWLGIRSGVLLGGVVSGARLGIVTMLQCLTRRSAICGKVISEQGRLRKHVPLPL